MFDQIWFATACFVLGGIQVWWWVAESRDERGHDER